MCNECPYRNEPCEPFPIFAALHWPRRMKRMCMDSFVFHCLDCKKPLWPMRLLRSGKCQIRPSSLQNSLVQWIFHIHKTFLKTTPVCLLYWWLIHTLTLAHFSVHPCWKQCHPDIPCVTPMFILLSFYRLFFSSRT